MNLRRATVDDLMGMQNCNLHNLPEVRGFLVLSRNVRGTDPNRSRGQNYQMKYCKDRRRRSLF